MSEQTGQAVSPPEWDLADRMRKGLRHADMSVQEMADYLEVSRNTVGAWINGKNMPSKVTLEVWALRCGVPFEWLRGPEGRSPRPPSGGGPRSRSRRTTPTEWYDQPGLSYQRAAA